MNKLVYRPEAVADVQAAFDWYEKLRPGLGDSFLEELRAAERAVQRSPTAFRERSAARLVATCYAGSRISSSIA